MSDRRDLITLLFGSAQADSGCDRCGDVLDRFVESERAGLAPSERYPEAAAHLAACPDCREDHDALVALLATMEASGEPGPH